jgi:ribosomal protein S27E
MNKTKSECEHENLYFGSGDYYIFCEDCGHTWQTQGGEHNLSAQQCNLSSQRRIKKAE